MNVKLLITIPSLALLAACSGGSLGEVSFDKLTPAVQAAYLLNAEPGTVKLNGKPNIEVPSVAATLGVNFDQSTVGSIVSITQGDFAGTTFERVDNIGGKPTYVFTASDIYESTSAIEGDLNTFHRVSLGFAGTDDPSESSSSIPGFSQNITTRTENYSDFSGPSGSSQKVTSVFIRENDSQVEAAITFSSIGLENGLENTYALSAIRVDESGSGPSQFNSEDVGTYSYTGVAIVDGEQSVSYTSRDATMEINFGDSSGSFHADTFVSNSNTPTPVIEIRSVLSIDNASGVISSTSGTITAGSIVDNFAMNGIVDFDNDAVAGTMIPIDGTSGIIGGIFVAAGAPSP